MTKTKQTLSPNGKRSNQVLIEEDFTNSIGSRVKYFRERLGLSQDELATRVGAAQQTIQSLESGKIRKSTFLPHIAKELGVDPDTLLFGNEQFTPINFSQSLSMVSSRRVPLFSTRDVKLIHAYLKDDQIQSPSGKWIAMDYSLPFSESGSRLFALKLELSDEAFQPEFRAGDQLVIDPDAPIQPTDPVIIFKHGSDRLNLSKYRVISESEFNTDYELISIHPDFPSFAGLQLKSIEILGPVIQMRRPISSRVRLAVLDQQARLGNNG
jgi:transcriptional regulator with XRE-family HTH domain